MVFSPRPRACGPHGSAGHYFRTDKIAFGSRVLFEPEIGIGAQINRPAERRGELGAHEPRQLFSQENPGIDNLGVRLNFAL